MAEAIDDASFRVLSDVVVAELTGCTDQRAEKRKSLRSCWSRHFRRNSKNPTVRSKGRKKQRKNRDSLSLALNKSSNKILIGQNINKI